MQSSHLVSAHGHRQADASADLVDRPRLRPVRLLTLAPGLEEGFTECDLVDALFRILNWSQVSLLDPRRGCFPGVWQQTVGVSHSYFTRAAEDAGRCSEQAGRLLCSWLVVHFVDLRGMFASLRIPGVQTQSQTVLSVFHYGATFERAQVGVAASVSQEMVGLALATGLETGLQRQVLVDAELTEGVCGLGEVHCCGEADDLKIADLIWVKP